MTNRSGKTTLPETRQPQPIKSKSTGKKWSHGLCSCNDDCGEC